MTGKLFANLESTDPRTLAQQELAELTDWLRRLGNGDYEFSDEQWIAIEKLFSPVEMAEIKGHVRALKYAGARAALPRRIEALRQFLGLRDAVTEAIADDRS